MGRLIYSMITSLDGCVEDADGRIEWGAPDEEVAGFVNDRVGSIGTYLFGRRMYETMAYWETAEVGDDDPETTRAFAAHWARTDKVVFSRTLESAHTSRTRLERTFDVGAVRQLKATREHDLAIGGPELAGQAVAASLVDLVELYVVPVVVGGGKPWLRSGTHVALELLEARPFASGVVFLRYRPV